MELVDEYLFGRLDPCICTIAFLGNPYHIGVVSVERWEKRIEGCQYFSRTWFVGSKDVKKDSIKKHMGTEPHKRAAELQKWSKIGAVQYQENVLINSRIGHGLRKMAEKD